MPAARLLWSCSALREREANPVRIAGVRLKESAAERLQRPTGGTRRAALRRERPSGALASRGARAVERPQAKESRAVE